MVPSLIATEKPNQQSYIVPSSTVSFAVCVHEVASEESLISKTYAEPEFDTFQSCWYAPTTMVPSLIATEVPKESCVAPSSARSFFTFVHEVASEESLFSKTYAEPEL